MTAPSASNTRVLNTSSPVKYIVDVTHIVDWLSYTAPEGTPVEQLLPVTPPIAWQDLPHGALGYRYGKRAGHVTVYWGGTVDGMGTHVVISGQGCRELEAWGLTSWWGYLKVITDSGWHVSRLDYAIDDRSGLLDLETVVTAFRAGQYTSPSLRWSVLDSGDRPGVVAGRTCYLGSTKSDTRIRIYDKAAEQDSPAGDHWIRVELQLRNDRATAAAAAHADAGEHSGELIAGLLRRQLDFKSGQATDCNKSRQQTADWWDAFLAGAAKVRLTLAPATRTLESVLGWLNKQVAPSLALVLAAAGGDLTGLVEMVESGRQRWTAEHRWMLEWSAPALAWAAAPSGP